MIELRKIHVSRNYWGVIEMKIIYCPFCGNDVRRFVIKKRICVSAKLSGEGSYDWIDKLPIYCPYCGRNNRMRE